MATTTTTAPTATQTSPAITPSPKLSAATYSYVDLGIKMERKFETLIEQATADKLSLGYNRDQCRVVVQTAFTQAYEKLAKEGKLEGEAAKAFVDTGMKRQGPNISKVMTLVFPKDDGAATELEKADAAGLGLNAKLEIARGNATVASIEAERANKAAGASKETARPGNGTSTPTATNATQPPTPETAATSKLTPAERAVTQIIAVIKFCESLGLTLEELPDLFEETLADVAAQRETAKQEQAAK